MSTRITKEVEKSIRSRILKERFESRYVATSENFKALANAVYNDVYSKKNQKLMQSLPKGWLCTSSGITVKFVGAGRSYERLNFSGSCDCKIMMYVNASQGNERLMPYADIDRCLKVYDADAPLSLEYLARRAAIESLSADYDAAQMAISSTIMSFRTVAILRKEWPEIAPFTDHLDSAKAGGGLPAVRISEINKILGL